MSSYRKMLFHVVFRTKFGKRVLLNEHSEELYSYICGIVKNKNCFVHAINGVSDHLHLLCDIHPSISLADFMRIIKASSSGWIKQSNKFPSFASWSEGYGAFSCSWTDKDSISNYIKNQRIHHSENTFEDELRRLCRENGVEINELFFP